MVIRYIDGDTIYRQGYIFFEFGKCYIYIESPMYPYLLYGIKQVSTSTLGRVLNDGEEFTVKRVGDNYLIFANGFIHKAPLYKPLCFIDMFCDKWAHSLIYHWIYCFVCTLLIIAFIVLFIIYIYLFIQGHISIDGKYRYMN
jgi:hypothetical protein